MLIDGGRGEFSELPLVFMKCWAPALWPRVPKPEPA